MLSQKHSEVYFCTSTVNDLCVLNLVGGATWDVSG